MNFFTELTHCINFFNACINTLIMHNYIAENIGRLQ